MDRAETTGRDNQSVAVKPASCALAPLLRSRAMFVLARVVLGGLFVMMGWKKTLDVPLFLKTIHLYQMLPESPAVFINSVAIALPYVEIICGIALILGVGLRGAGLVAAVMLAVFTPAIFSRTLAIRAETGQSFFSIRFDCGCGAGPVTAWIKLLENTGLFVLALVVLLVRSRFLALEGLWQRRLRPQRPVAGIVGQVKPG